MRLLNTTTLKVKEFVSERPKYAILSHTWGSEEIVLQDTEAKDEAPSSVKAGWKKIRGACALALGDGFDWIWIDTCCIDKSSSSELSEAINSMFRWYREAEICYAYLEDVPPLRYASLIGFQDLALDLDSNQTMSIRKDQNTFLGSRWFTRGWTLQELIAPQRVEFHASDWSFLGTRSDLSDIIHKHTMIDKVVLEANGAEKLSTFSVWSRMQWAASRETTRVEDTAYCLLGIFEINMPLLYGEGERAFRRLQEEIIRTIEDYSLIAWTSYDASPQPLRIHSSALASHPRDFGTMRLDTTCVPKAAIERDFDKDMRGISVRESPGPRLITLEKEMMLKCIKPYFGGYYRNINHPQLQPDFSPPTLSPRGISITMFTTRVLNPDPNTRLAWTTLYIQLPKATYYLCIKLSNEETYMDSAARAFRRNTNRLYLVPITRINTFESTTFYLRATPEYYVEFPGEAWSPGPGRSQLRFDRRNETVSTTVLATYPSLKMEMKGDAYAFQTEPREFGRAAALMCDPIWAFVVEVKELRGCRRVLQFAVLYGNDLRAESSHQRWRCKVTPAPSNNDSSIGFQSFLSYTEGIVSLQQSSIRQFPWGIVGAVVHWDNKENHSFVDVMIHLESQPEQPSQD